MTFQTKDIHHWRETVYQKKRIVPKSVRTKIEKHISGLADETIEAIAQELTTLIKAVGKEVWDEVIEKERAEFEAYRTKNAQPEEIVRHIKELDAVHAESLNQLEKIKTEALADPRFVFAQKQIDVLAERLVDKWIDGGCNEKERDQDTRKQIYRSIGMISAATLGLKQVGNSKNAIPLECETDIK